MASSEKDTAQEREQVQESSHDASSSSRGEAARSSRIPPALKRFMFFLLRLMIVTVLAFALLATISYVTISHFITGKVIPAPNVINYTVDEALQSLSRQNLSLLEQAREFNEIVEKGKIISQYPEPGTKVKVRTAVKVVLSDGPEMVAVPDVRGENYREAGIVIREKILKVGSIAYLNHDKIEKDVVIAQEPPPNAKVLRGARVNLLISLGRGSLPVTLPNLTSLTIPEATQLLASINLSITTMELSADSAFGAGLIAAQEPRAGTTVDSETPVKIIVSSSP